MTEHLNGIFEATAGDLLSYLLEVGKIRTDLETKAM